ncbi:HIRAN domain-containing protein [Endozoicomonas sp. 4G]|uniref:HIRAN domain-containing protein n=1 Tax=Endozoicomonas sp. 4G TaxID=2872754 RepID=UPI002078738E|nr:HIRAN domain-containing protein [Endozoicomonas sp. 4G]
MESRDRSRFVVGELVRKEGKIVFNYFKDTEDFQQACLHGFAGHPAFRIRDGVISYENQVLEAFTRRIPPRNRSDFYRYLELRGLNPDAEMSDFTLLGYVGARLPDDGFELVHPFDNANGPFEFVTEVAGFRHESEISSNDLAVSALVQFIPEPDNRHDSDAIRIEMDGNKLGYVDRGRLELFHRHLKAGHSVSGEIMRKNGTNERPLIFVYTKVNPQFH